MKFKGYTIVTDMDGTLLNSKGKLSKENENAIKEFVLNGGNFTVATGRMLPSVGRFIDRLNVTLPVILYNGLKIYDYKTKEVISEEFLEEERKSIIKKIKENTNFGIEIYTEETIYIYNPCKYTERFSKLGYEVIYNVTDEIFKKNWNKVLILGEADEMNFFEENYNNLYEQGAVVRTGEKYLEIIPNNSSKGKALERLCKDYNIDKDKLITIGDNMNDIELLNVGALGFCVENAPERMKSKVKLFAPSNDENVMEFLLEYITKKL